MGNTIKFVQGNEACVEAALYAGLDFYAGYPITPSTEIAELLAYRLPQSGGKFIQMEDEIASLCAIIGASLTGRKVLTATSGPGFSLMQEALGYAIMTEIPCVIANVQRGGPSTGMPTRTQQADILSCAYASHGDTKQVLLFPSTPAECFEQMGTAFDLAEQLQTPVLVMTDLDLGMNNWMSDAFTYPTTPINRGKLLTAEKLKELGIIEELDDVHPGVRAAERGRLAALQRRRPAAVDPRLLRPLPRLRRIRPRRRRRFPRRSGYGLRAPRRRAGSDRPCARDRGSRR